MKQNSTESVNLAPKRNPNPLPEVDSRWIAHNRRGEIVIVDKVVFDQETRENRIWYHEERTGYRGSTWQSRFRQRKTFTAVSEPTPAVATVEVLPVQAVSTEPAPEPEHGPPCVECGAPCRRRKGTTGYEKWRSTCSAKCLAKYRAGLMAKGRSTQADVQARSVSDQSLPSVAKSRNPEVGPPCVECGAPCQRWKNGSKTWRSTCSAKCLTKCRISGGLRQSAQHGPAAKGRVTHDEPKVPEVFASTTKRAANGSAQVTLRLSAEILDALEGLALAQSRPGLELTQTQALRLAIVWGLRALKKQ